MYWLRSLFDISSVNNAKLLSRIYCGVNGELKGFSCVVTEEDLKKKPLFEIKWCENPFSKLVEDFGKLSTPSKFQIYARLVGPQTIMAISPKIKKLNSDVFDHPQKKLILEWASYIDDRIHEDMKKSDLFREFILPSKKLNSTNDLITACRLAKYPTFVLPFEYGVVTGNLESRYLSGAPLEGGSISTDLKFDIDGGVVGHDSEYFNKKFQKWKSEGFEKSLSEYYPEFKEHFFLDE